MSQKEREVEAVRKKYLLITRASNAIAPLQDAVELGMATEKEKEKLVAWKTYRVMLNRIDTSQETDITWPEDPK